MKLWHLLAVVFIAGYFGFVASNHNWQSLEDQRDDAFEAARIMETFISGYRAYYVVSVTPDLEHEHVWIAYYLSPTREPMCMSIDMDEFPFARYFSWRTRCRGIDQR